MTRDRAEVNSVDNERWLDKRKRFRQEITHRIVDPIGRDSRLVERDSVIA